MTEDYHDINKVKIVINTLYSQSKTPQTSNQNISLKEASAWLEKFRESEYAWHISDQLLNSEFNFKFENSNTCLEFNQNKFILLFFAAQTLKSKIVQYFHQLPKDSYLSLRDSILQHLKKISSLQTSSSNQQNSENLLHKQIHQNLANNLKILITQLTIAIADLTLQITDWKTPISDMIDLYLSNTNEGIFLIDYLKILPEELSAKSIKIGESRRKEFIELLKLNWA